MTNPLLPIAFPWVMPQAISWRTLMTTFPLHHLGCNQRRCQSWILILEFMVGIIISLRVKSLFVIILFPIPSFWWPGFLQGSGRRIFLSVVSVTLLLRGYESHSRTTTSSQTPAPSAREPSEESSDQESCTAPTVLHLTGWHRPGW